MTGNVAQNTRPSFRFSREGSGYETRLSRGVACMACKERGLQGVWHAKGVACKECGMQRVRHAKSVACKGRGLQGMWHARGVACKGHGLQGAWLAVGMRLYNLILQWQGLHKYCCGHFSITTTS